MVSPDWSASTPEFPGSRASFLTALLNVLFSVSLAVLSDAYYSAASLCEILLWQEGLYCRACQFTLKALVSATVALRVGKETQSPRVLLLSLDVGPALQEGVQMNLVYGMTCMCWWL